MDNIIHHNFGRLEQPEDKEPETGENIELFTPKQKIPEGVTMGIIRDSLKKFLSLEEILNGLVGWGKNAETVAIRKSMVERMSDDEVIIDLGTSDETLWRQHPAYYAAIWDRFNQIRVSGKLLKKISDSPFDTENR